jgi:hypothetical protein
MSEVEGLVLHSVCKVCKEVHRERELGPSLFLKLTSDTMSVIEHFNQQING